VEDIFEPGSARTMTAPFADLIADRSERGGMIPANFRCSLTRGARAGSSDDGAIVVDYQPGP
jgi:hypothetical protein